MAKEGKIVSGMGSLALVAKAKKAIEEEGSESDISNCELSNEEYAFMGSNTKRFAKNNFGRNKNTNWQGIYNSEKVKDESINNPQMEEVKKEKKFMGDSNYDCNYCHGKNHLSKECMLKRMNEKKE